MILDLFNQFLVLFDKNVKELLENSVDAGSTRIDVSLEKGGSEVIRVADNGCGLPPDRTRLFEPYVTTREKGTGLGLPIVKKIIEEHGGTLALTDAAPFDGSGRHGAMAVIRLPRARARRETTRDKEKAAEAAGGGK